VLEVTQLSLHCLGYDQSIIISTVRETGLAFTQNREKISTPDVISSLRWHQTSPMVLSWTEEGGSFNVFDTRTNDVTQHYAFHEYMVMIRCK
jgi:hypothetical protein